MIAPTTSIAARPHRVLVQNPTPAVSDGDAGYTQTPVNASPAEWYVQIRSATAQDMERARDGTNISIATHVITGPFHPQVTTQTQLVFGAHTFQVLGVASPDLLEVETTVLVAEVIT